MDTIERKMRLGVASEWSPWQPRRGQREHAPYDYECGGLYVCQPYARFFERVNTKRRYRSGPRPWRPGRYRTAAWEPYYGFGRFSGLPEIMQGRYHAARYTGRHVTPEHYILRHSGVEAYEKSLAETWRKTSWLPAPAREASAEHLSPRQVSQPIRDESK